MFVLFQVGDLVHNEELDEIAQSWAETVADNGKLSHSGASYRDKKMGENVASKWSSKGADYTGKATNYIYSNAHMHLGWGNTCFDIGNTERQRLDTVC